jgi:aquaporin Z
MTLMFLLIILGSTDRRAPADSRHCDRSRTDAHPPHRHSHHQHIGEPARITGPTLVVGDWALGQLWLFWVAPILGAVIAGYLYRWLGENR